MCVHNSWQYNLIASIALIYLVCSFVSSFFACQHSFSKQVNLYQCSHFSEMIGIVCSQDCLGSLTAPTAEDRRRRTLFAWWVDPIFPWQLTMIELIDYGTQWICLCSKSLGKWFTCSSLKSKLSSWAWTWEVKLRTGEPYLYWFNTSFGEWQLNQD